MEPLILYHKDCLDGLGAALAAYLKFGERAEYVAMGYETKAPDLSTWRNREVYILDFSFPRETVLKLLEERIDFTLIDHHVSAKNDLHDLIGKKMIIDLEHSGAVLAWMVFHPGYEIPEMLRYIEDKDLWRWCLRDSREINTALESLEKSLPHWKSVLYYWHSEKRGYIVAGRTLLRHQDEMVARICANFEMVCFEGEDLFAVNTPVLVNESCEALLRQVGPMAAAYHRTQDSCFKVSLRSIGNFDVSEIARKFGGGGHKNAAGFHCKKLPWGENEPVWAATG